jgi:L-fucose isomerase-like protein
MGVDDQKAMAGLGGVDITPSRLRLSSFWRGMTVTISISQRKATSAGARPSGRGNAIVNWEGWRYK